MVPRSADGPAVSRYGPFSRSANVEFASPRRFWTRCLNDKDVVLGTKDPIRVYAKKGKAGDADIKSWGDKFSKPRAKPAAGMRRCVNSYAV